MFGSDRALEEIFHRWVRFIALLIKNSVASVIKTHKCDVSASFLEFISEDLTLIELNGAILFAVNN